jgi:hypothetical protein
MSPEVAATIFKATLLSPSLLEIIAKTSGKPSRTYKFQAPADDYLAAGDTPALLKGQPIVLYQDDTGATIPIPYYASEVSADDTTSGGTQPSDALSGDALSGGMLFGFNKTEGAGGPSRGPNKSNWKKVLRTLVKYESDRDKERKQGKKGLSAPHKKDTGNGIECPVCFLESKDGPYVSIRLTTIPTIEIICSCGYSGRRTL